MRKIAAARLADGWVRELSNRPPETRFFGREREPRREVLGGRPAGHVGANLGDQFQRGIRANAVNLREIDAARDLMQRRAQLEARIVVGVPAVDAGRGQRRGGPRPGRRQALQVGLDGVIARRELASDTRRRGPDSAAGRRRARADSGRSRRRRSPRGRRDTDSPDGGRAARGRGGPPRCRAES